MTTFDHAASLGYDRRATRLLGSLYRRIAADIDTMTGPGATVADIGTGPGRLLSCLAEQLARTRAALDAVAHVLDCDAEDFRTCPHFRDRIAAVRRGDTIAAR